MLALGLACAWAAAAAAAPAPPPLRIVTSLEPRAVAFGDPLTATVEVDFDPRTVEGSSIAVRPSFAPYELTAAPVVQRPRAGVLRVRYSLLCVTSGCLPTGRVLTLRLARVEVAALAGRRTLTVGSSWPPLRVSSRLSPADLRGQLRFRSPARPPRVDYRLAPGPLAAGLLAAAGVALVAALLLAGRGLARRSRRPGVRALSPLELAIAFVRDSAGRSTPDRRRALALLAETAGRQGEPVLADDAADAAWSEPSPTPAGAFELAERAAGTGGTQE